MMAKHLTMRLSHLRADLDDQLTARTRITALVSSFAGLRIGMERR
jgi:hypothetical protein